MSSSNKIILGTAQFGLNYGINNFNGQPNQERVNELLDVAFSKNIQLLDTAEAYGNSQEVIGAYHRQSSNRFKIITKFSSSRTDLSGNIIERVQGDIETLGVNNLYCFMFHNYADFKSYHSEFESGINQMKKEHLIENFGVSIYTNEELEDLLNYENINTIQLPFNLLDNSTQRASIIQKARERGVEIHTRSVFLQGLFFKSSDTISENLSPLSKSINELKELAKLYDIELSRLALNYALQQDFIDNVLIGIDTVDQLKENLQLIDDPIIAEVMERIDKIDVKDKTLLNPSKWK